MSYYRKRPVIIEAKRYAGNTAMDVYLWIEEHVGSLEWHDYLLAELAPSRGVTIDPSDGSMVIMTLEGAMKASLGDYIIQGIAGEFYPCKPDIFEKTYEAV